MQYLSCDICKKMITDPKRGRNYFTLKHRHMCKKCKLEIERAMQDKAEAENKPYNFLAKKEEFWVAVDKKCSK